MDAGHLSVHPTSHVISIVETVHFTSPHDKRQWLEIRFLRLQFRFKSLLHTITALRLRTQHKMHVTLPLCPPSPIQKHVLFE
jgi:hypothetical protein